MARETLDRFYPNIWPKKGLFIELDSGESVGASIMGRNFIQSVSVRDLVLVVQESRGLFVKKDIDQNEVYVVRGDDHPSLYTNEAMVNGFKFIYRK